MGNYKETTSFEVYGDPCLGEHVEARCPACGGMIVAEVEDDLSAGFEGDCQDCERHFYCYLKLVLEWE